MRRDLITIKETTVPETSSIHKASFTAVLALACLSGAASSAVLRSSHNDAPRIKQDPQANLTDVYAFIGTKYDDPSIEVLNVIANVRPFSEPGDGPHYERFAPDARYSLHITNPTTGAEVRRYDFFFTPVDDGYKNENTILSYGLGTEAGPILSIDDERQNFTQTYGVLRQTGNAYVPIFGGGLVPPPNVGSNVTPSYNDDAGLAKSGAEVFGDLDIYTQEAISEGITGETFFAGPRDDGFYGDVPGIFDLLNVRILDNNGTLDDGLGQDGDGVDGFKGFNVLTYGVQIPLTDLPSFEYNDAFFGLQNGLGVYASVSRSAVTVRTSGDDVSNSGDWVQVNRLGNPLFNEALVPFADKDRYNSVAPTEDSQFATYASNPELAELINLVFGTAFETADRADLVAVFIPDVLRVSTETGPVTLPGRPNYSRFGFVGGDLTGDVSSGWPNGRRFGDDVIDIALTAIASGPSYSTITVVGDNVPSNDIAYHNVFPYAATPHAGTMNRKDPPPTDTEIADVNRDGVINVFDIFDYIEAFNNSK